MELKGTIKRVFTARQGVSKSGNEWVMQEFLLEVPVWGGTKDVLFTVSGAERIQRFNLKEGEKNVTVHFEVEARCFTNGRSIHASVNSVSAPMSVVAISIAVF